MTLRKTWQQHAEDQGVPVRTLANVKADLAQDKAKNDGTDVAMARLMLRHGRLTTDAREFVAREYPQCAS